MPRVQPKTVQKGNTMPDTKEPKPKKERRSRATVIVADLVKVQKSLKRMWLDEQDTEKQKTIMDMVAAVGAVTEGVKSL